MLGIEDSGGVMFRAVCGTVPVVTFENEFNRADLCIATYDISSDLDK